MPQATQYEELFFARGDEYFLWRLRLLITLRFFTLPRR